MLTVYTVCAVVGTIFLVIQLLLTLVGIGDHHDVFVADHGDLMDQGALAAHHDSTWFFSVLSLRSLVAAVAFFGLGGRLGESVGISAYPTFLLALLAGVAAMVVVAWMMRLLVSMRHDGTAHIESAMGMPGTVYLTIPGHRKGHGKVTVSLPNRITEYEAVTSGQDLATGSSVVVVGILNDSTVEVEGETPEEG